MGIIVLALFWVGVIFAFFVLGARIALTFIGLWILGLLVISFLHIPSPGFLAYQALLAASLCFMLKREWS